MTNLSITTRSEISEDFICAALRYALEISTEINKILDDVYKSCEYAQKLYNERNK